MPAFSFDEGTAWGERFDDFDLMLKFQHLGNSLSRLARAQEWTGKDLIELQSEFTYPLRSLFQFRSALEGQGTVFIFQNTGITEVCRDSMTHQIELNHRSLLSKRCWMLDTGC